jgi:hypothetical protein
LSVSQQYPTLSCSVPVYNFLFDRLEDEYDRRKEEKGVDDVVVKALEASKKKLNQYYAYTSGIIYAVTTGKYNYFTYIILLYLY